MKNTSGQRVVVAVGLVIAVVNANGCAAAPQVAVPIRQLPDDAVGADVAANTDAITQARAIEEAAVMRQAATAQALVDARTAETEAQADVDAAVSAGADEATLAPKRAALIEAVTKRQAREHQAREAEQLLAAAQLLVQQRETTGMYSWGWDDAQQIGSGYDYCARLEGALRTRAANVMGWGYFFTTLGAAAAATGTTVLAVDDEIAEHDVARAVATLSPLVTGALLAGAFALFSDAASLSDGASKAAKAATSDTSAEAANQCNAALADWNSARAQAARAAAEGAHAHDDELTQRQNELLKEFLIKQLTSKLGIGDLVPAPSE